MKQKYLTEERFVELFEKMFKAMVKETNLVTKKYLENYIESKNFASGKYVEGIAKEIVEAVSIHHDKIEEQINEEKLTYVPRNKFEALKKKVQAQCQLK